jgi:hypothetical protein
MTGAKKSGPLDLCTGVIGGLIYWCGKKPKSEAVLWL